MFYIRTLTIYLDNYNTRRLDVIHCIQSHVGSVKSIAFVMDNCLPLLKSSIASTGRISNSKTHKDDKFGNFIGNNQPYLLFTCGSRTSLKCSCIVFEGFGSHINSFVLSEIGSRDKRKTQKEKGNDLRFMSLQIISLDRYITFPDSAQYYCIVIGCSDGFIRFVFVVFSSPLKRNGPIFFQGGPLPDSAHV